MKASNSEVDKTLKLYKESQFYETYKNSYASDKILKKVFGIELRAHSIDKLKTYSQVHQYNVDVMNDFIRLFSTCAGIKDKEMLGRMIDAVYIDPDGHAIDSVGGVPCSADGLLSIKRIYRKFGISEEMIREYEYYRRIPIFFFPTEKNGINVSRYRVFGDKIDHALFDLKSRFEEKECKLFKAYNLPKTSKWISTVGTFERLVDTYGIKGIFVNDKYEVYDLEKDDGESVIEKYADKYSRCWSDLYYDNLKKKIDEFMQRHASKLAPN